MDYFAKKQWIRIAVCAVLVIAVVMAMTGVFSGKESLTYDPSAKSLAAGAVTAEATEQGFGGDVTVNVTLDGDKVQELTIDTPNETEGLGKRASEEAFTSQFIGKSGPFTFGEDEIEALSGATVTSNAALKAINRAVTGEEAPEEETPAEETKEEPKEESKEEPAEETEPKEAADGTTIDATEQGFGGDVTAHITLDGDKIQALTIETPNETAGLGQRASEEAFTGQFIGKSGPFTYGEDGVDALSGATITSNAALKAINSVFGGGEEAAPTEETKDTPAEETATKEETKTEEAAANGQAYGVYRVTKENAFSKVTVTAAAKNGTLTSVKITSEGEEGKDLLTDAIREEWGKAILESGSAAPDAITGASLKFSAGSVQEAMTEILEKMNGGAEQTAAEPEEKAEAQPEEKPAEEPAAQEETKTETKAEEAAAGGQAYGVYRSTKENAFSKVTVTAAVKNGTLTSVKITSEGEEGKDLLTDAIREEWAKAILESGSAAPDAITGASLKFSAGSVQEAMTEILAKMNGETAEPAAEPAEEPEAETKEEPSEDPVEETGEKADGGNDILSLITVSMGKEEENSYVTDYLEQDPYLVNIYEGYGFAKDYGSARGHFYTLTDVEKTQRPHAKANCLTCKTPDMHKMIEEQGVSVYSMPFDEVMAQMTQPIGCYTCHGADDGNGGKLVVTHQYVNEALGENVSTIKAASLSCGQCHIEYYFTPENSETMMPYHSVAEMTPEAILAYYDNLGFYDWEQPGTGTKMLKAQHPELETYLYGKHASMLSCADCHMPAETTESGVQYHDHHLVSPLNSESLLAKCAVCHGSAENTVSLVQGIQTKVTARETEVGNKLSALKDELTAAVSAGSMNEEELNAVRKLHREAQWFFDFCYVENSEGAHNSSLAYSCLDTSEAKIDEAMGLLASAGTADAEPAPAEETTPAEEASAAEEQTTEQAAAETAEPKTVPAYAGYRAEAVNNFSKVTIIAYAKNGVLTSVKILSEGEGNNDLLNDDIRGEWAKAILESGSAAPDAITSASLQFSAGSVQEAMTEILDKINGK